MKKIILSLLFVLLSFSVFAGESRIFYDAYSNMSLAEVKNSIPGSIAYESMEGNKAYFKQRNDSGTVVGKIYMTFIDDKLKDVSSHQVYAINAQTIDYLYYKFMFLKDGKLVEEVMERGEWTDFSNDDDSVIAELEEGDNGYEKGSSMYMDLGRKTYAFKTIIHQEEKRRHISIIFDEKKSFIMTFKKL